MRGIRPLCTLLFVGLGHVLRAEEIPGWQVEWQRTVEAANREGQLDVYTTFPQVLDAGVFQKAYPGIRVRVVPGRGAQNQQRILTEKRAGKHLVDVFNAGVTLYGGISLDPMRPALILPEVADNSHWWQRKHRYGDPDGRFIFVYAGVPQTGSVSYSTHHVNPMEFKSVWDFLKQKWKGRIEARDIRAPGPGGGATRFFYHHPEIGPEFIRRLFSEMEITLFRDWRQGTDWLARGKFAICFFCSGVHQAKQQGLPVNEFGVMKEGAGLVAQDGALAIVNRAPHPNAAKVFVNWFLSREGQLTLQKALAKAGEDALDSLRTDIPKDEVPAGNRRVEGLTYLEMFKPELLDMRPVLQVFEKALMESGKK